MFCCIFHAFQWTRMKAAFYENDLRSNVIKESLPQSGLKTMTSEYMDNYFRVPKVLGSGA